VDTETYSHVAMREAREFRRRLTMDAIGGQFIMIAILGLMTYFDVGIRWVLIVGFFLSVGTLSGLIIECAMRSDAGRSYLEQWTDGAGETLDVLRQESWSR
jgi:hypothetical protein